MKKLFIAYYLKFKLNFRCANLLNLVAIWLYSLSTCSFYYGRVAYTADRDVLCLLVARVFHLFLKISIYLRYCSTYPLSSASICCFRSALGVQKLLNSTFGFGVPCSVGIHQMKTCTLSGSFIKIIPVSLS